jgi:hypothetical protein
LEGPGCLTQESFSLDRATRKGHKLGNIEIEWDYQLLVYTGDVNVLGKYKYILSRETLSSSGC